ncbi:DUF896 domain-containing protein [Acetivibrio mesophilus]|uniref:UPF0291 protein EFD62_09470 n=1 Tax=Acetivibrio mesophilus TaxID=2487273 RepID=A0A4Q0I425_9FIRM|nr:DUF896 domain-containing protein [Acetivibrio mesophilus]ODM27816.1 hypothetical protein A7W90_17215 [Clostridium sp. Bc-iso-3]RXE59016.1 DUF896 domain-containing protein [Acetivibrio mesophilus]HHV30118.1 DUF896 domain-containing protein [Clostridium sp.]
MNHQELINRINELSRKSKSVGLTDEEKEEQQTLRQEYLKIFRSNFKATLDSVVIVDKDGNRRALRKDN